jgi:hypothetical protein
VEDFLEFAGQASVWVGLFVGLTHWYARTVLRGWDLAPFLVVIGVSLAAATLLLVLRAPTLLLPTIGGYVLGLVLASIVYVGLYRLSEGRWPAKFRPTGARPGR